MIRLIRYLLRAAAPIRYPRAAMLSGLGTGLAGGIGYTSLIGLVNASLTGTRSSGRLLTFALLGLGVTGARLLSQALFDLVAARASFAVRLGLCRQILAAPLRQLERIGPHRLLAVLSDDVASLTTALAQLPQLGMNLAIAMACLVYMGWLSWQLLLLTLAFMALGLVSYQLPMGRSSRLFRRLREQLDVQLRHFRALTHGAKELKLQRRRRHELIASSLVPTGQAIQRFTFAGNALFALAAVWGNLLFFFAFGLLLFELSRHAVPLPVVTGYTLALLYLMSPLELVLSFLPSLSRAAVAVGKLDRLGLELASAPEAETPPAAGAARWRSLELSSVTFAYQGDPGDDEFRIGPLDLSLHPGELVFLTGGNGSGKTTLAKVLTGLYVPDGGEILLDGRQVTEQSRGAYRELFATVFADFHLFETLAAGTGTGDETARDLLRRFQLDGAVSVAGGRFSTLDLSHGQRKRLALLEAFLDDRPIYFFDEWAADQDPEFRAVFYCEILPQLRARGKAVVVASHDDRYYDVADRLIKLTGGRVEWQQTASRRPVLPAT
jgi:putative ATP-binding cassette transporter